MADGRAAGEGEARRRGRARWMAAVVGHASAVVASPLPPGGAVGDENAQEGAQAHNHAVVGAKRAFNDEYGGGAATAEPHRTALLHQNGTPYHPYRKRARTAWSPSRGVHNPQNNPLEPLAARQHIAAQFPEMSDAEVDAALNAHGADIAKAIEHLAALRLARTSGAAAAAAAAEDGPAQQRSAPASPPAEAEAEEDAKLPQTHAAWVDAVVGELQNAANVPRAKSIVDNALTAYGRQVRRRALSSCASAPPSGACSPTAAKTENAILKRAVAIQSARMEQMSAEGRRLNDEVARLNGVCAEQAAEISRLQASNYALAVHLQRASSGNSGGPSPGGHGEAF